MTGYELPTSLNIGGVDFNIRTDYRAILDILIACNDPDLDEYAKSEVMIKILFIDWDDIPESMLEEACEKACDFIDCGQKEDKKRPKLIDWQQDASIIIPAVNKVAHMEVRAVPYMHWWTFFSYFMEIGESLFSNVISYRNNRAKHKKPEKWEKDFYKENKSLIDFKSELSEEEKKQKETIAKWL